MHDGQGLFLSLPNPFVATRYHSLVVSRETVPGVLEVCANSEDGEIMGIRHRDLPIVGVQFHPESVMTKAGKKILENFLTMCSVLS
jgi:anthranilate synthase/aminodeoxychorismate synthase-like glutamine amidotransferase